jgi:hypothetical protein
MLSEEREKYDAKNLPRERERKPCPGEVCGRRQQGLDVRKNSSPGGWGEVFLLDIPFYRTVPLLFSKDAEDVPRVVESFQRRLG